MYYAREIDGEHFDYKYYYNECEAKYDMMWFGGNSDFCDINSELYTDVIHLLEDIKYSYDEIVEDECDWNDFEKEVIGLVKQYNLIKNTFLDKTADLTTKDITALYELSGSESEETVAKVLSIITGQEFSVRCLKGYSQSDWMSCVYPKDMERKLDYIESVLFATGTEYEVSTEELNSIDEFDDADTEFIYTYHYNIKDIKLDIAKELETTPDNIAVYKISNIRKIVKYEYNEVK